MEFDWALATIGSMGVVIIVLIVYIAYRFREEKVSMVGIDVNDLLNRWKEAEHILQSVRESRCWNCGSIDKEVMGNLYQDDEIRIRCKQCSTETLWKRGRKEWKLTTGTRSFVQLLEEKIAMEKAKTGGK
ncbi:MAG: hypothetical protein NZ932_03955 [Candidatus Bathyarchaeota archaeon]|nr:hypothetical protein [Candidatus Bathyarchaeota archaeon]MDW8022377.1 hypothetical protein [Nitrososphaerota archaeon]